ncbi:MAG: hypothetical protein WDO19_05705 [Bacteroidota bacterium]
MFEGEVSNDLSDPSNFSNAEKIKDAFTDKHDNAEDATFLEPEVKAQLKATLTEMWNAELQLRTFKPQQALPFEYKALRLLKDLQQKSRAYVAKTNFKTTPLDLQKRMTGDLSKISPPAFHKDIKGDDDPQVIVRTALGILEQIKLTNSTKDISQEPLRQANIRLNEKAIQQPSLYLQPVQSLRKIINDWNAGMPISKNDIHIAENGLQRMLSDPALLPSAEKNNRRSNYRNNILLTCKRSNHDQLVFCIGRFCCIAGFSIPERMETPEQIKIDPSFIRFIDCCYQPSYIGLSYT